MREPRGHSAMSGAILQPPMRPDADWGVLFIEVSGCLPMCGHGTIGVATVLVETGMVAVTEPETIVRLDTPAGLVVVRVEVRDGRALSVTLRNVPAFLAARDRVVEVDGWGTIPYDMAFGGNFYAIVDAAAAGVVVDPAESDRLIACGADIMAAIDAVDRPVHPEDPRISGCHHVVLHTDGTDGAHARAATSIHPGWLDRSPCGTGTSARLAQLHARGVLGVGEAFVNESVLGTRFTGRIVEETTIGSHPPQPAIVPEITGRAWITGMGQYLLADDDPFPSGFRLG
jgi:proline racemase